MVTMLLGPSFAYLTQQITPKTTELRSCVPYVSQSIGMSNRFGTNCVALHPNSTGVFAVGHWYLVVP
jgi:hypothetical protein